MSDDAPDAGTLDDVLPDPLPAIYYDPKAGNYLWSMPGDKWLPLSEKSSRRLMLQKGMRSKPQGDEILSEIEGRLAEIQTERFIEYIGPLAGCDPGYREHNGHRVLVTGGVRPIVPMERPWPTLRIFLHNLLDAGDEPQSDYLLSWLKLGLEARLSGVALQAPGMVFAGEKNSGKSLAQSLVSEFYGGSAGRPFEWMMGQTTFNEDLFPHVHQCIEDEASSSDIRSRRIFAAAIKRMVTGEEARCHAKGRAAVMLRPFWRLTISVNSEPEALLVLPPMDDHMTDKLVILLVNAAEMPMPTDTPAARTLFRQTLTHELAGLAWDLLHAYEIPDHIRGGRFCMQTFQHPQIMDALCDLAPETRLWSLIDAELFSTLAVEEFEGTAAELDRRLRSASGANGAEATRVLTFGNAAGVFLGRLAKRHADRISERLLDGHRIWTIKPPRG